MGIREAIRQHSMLTVAVVAVVGLAAVAYSVRSTVGGPPTAETGAFYTIDDGQTWFEGNMSQLPPFQHEGKTAYRVWLYTSDGGKTKFVGYLERYTPEARKRIENGLAAHKAGTGPMPPITMADVEVKKPGAGNPWINSAHMAEASKVTQVKGPGNTEATVVLP